MLLQFQVIEDSSWWLIDSDKLRFSRVSVPLTDLEKWEKGEAETEEFGELKLVSPIMELYRLNGRDVKTEGPGCGLTSVAILVRIVNTVLEIQVSANVPVKNPTCLKEINQVRCEVIGVGHP